MQCNALGCEWQVLRVDGCLCLAADEDQETWKLSSSCLSLEELAWHTSDCSGGGSECVVEG